MKFWAIIYWIKHNESIIVFYPFEKELRWIIWIRCKVYIAINPNALSGEAFTQELVENTIAHFKQAQLSEDSSNISYPGENTRKRGEENLEKGIPVDTANWEQVLQL